MPPALQAAFESVYERALQQAKAAADAATGKVLADIEARASLIGAKEQELVNRAAGFKDSAETLRLELAGASATVAEWTARNADLKIELAAAQQKTAVVEQQLAKVTAQQLAQAVREEKELRRVREQAALHEDRLHRQIDSLRTDVKTLRSEKAELTKALARERVDVAKSLSESQAKRAQLEKIADLRLRRVQTLEVSLAEAHGRASQVDELRKSLQRIGRSKSPVPRSRAPVASKPSRFAKLSRPA